LFSGDFENQRRLLDQRDKELELLKRLMAQIRAVAIQVRDENAKLKVFHFFLNILN
jgi:hypothetical protein